LNAKHDALISAKINESAASHAWWETVILSLTVTGRHSGIVASDLSFLRKTHPALWAAVSSCGSPSCFAAGAGIVSHYLAESVAYKPLLEPFTDEAEIAMEMGLWEAKHA
jgi:hypothetical protein